MPKTIQVFDWYDEVQPLLIERLGIEPANFRGYVQVEKNGRYEQQYRDWWHVFLSTYGEYLTNDSYFDLAEIEDAEYATDRVVEEYGDWAGPFVRVMNAIIRELAGVEDPDEIASIVVWISW